MQQELGRHDELLAALAKVVQSRREKLGFSQEEVAKRAGLHRTYISDIERGARNLSVRSLSRLAEALQITPSALVHSAETFDARSPMNPALWDHRVGCVAAGPAFLRPIFESGLASPVEYGCEAHRMHE